MGEHVKIILPHVKNNLIGNQASNSLWCKILQKQKLALFLSFFLLISCQIVKPRFWKCYTFALSVNILKLTNFAWTAFCICYNVYVLLYMLIRYCGIYKFKIEYHLKKEFLFSFLVIILLPSKIRLPNFLLSQKCYFHKTPALEWWLCHEPFFYEFLPEWVQNESDFEPKLTQIILHSNSLTQ